MTQIKTTDIAGIWIKYQWYGEMIVDKTNIKMQKIAFTGILILKITTE